MSSWSWHLFKISGIPLSVHYSFLLLLAYIGYQGWMAQGVTGLIWSVLTVCAFFACVVLHELGHSFAARRYGVGVQRILLMPIGGMAEFDSLPREPSKELVITIAGPAVNFVLAALLWWPVNQLPQNIMFYSAQGLLFQLLWSWVCLISCPYFRWMVVVSFGRYWRPSSLTSKRLNGHHSWEKCFRSAAPA